MRERHFLLRKAILFIVLLIFIAGFSITASAKTVIKAGDDRTVSVDEELEFQGTGDGDYSWDFDESKDLDGDGDFTNDAEKTGKSVSYKFKSTGTYKVTLTQTVGNETTTHESTITVEEESIFTPWAMGLIFVIIGVVMFLAEASSPGFFIGIPASILVVIGIIGIGFPQIFFTIWSPIIATIVAVITTIVIIDLYKRLAPPEVPTTTAGDSLIGREGIITITTVPESLTKGKVKIGSDIWSATSKLPLRVGTPVVVVASEGVHVTVEKSDKKKIKSTIKK
jgi:membrane protein implicated in regulation of membrane protease activity